MDRWVTLPKRVTSPSWGPPPPSKQTLTSGRPCLVPEASCHSTQSMRFGSRGPSEEVVSFSFTTKYNSFFWPYKQLTIQRPWALYFRSPKTSGLSFQQLPVVSGTTTKFPKKRTTTRGIPTFSTFFSRKCSSLSTLLSDFFQNFRLNGSHFGNSTVSGNSGNFSVLFAAVSKFSKVLLEWKAPLHLIFCKF